MKQGEGEATAQAVSPEEGRGACPSCGYYVGVGPTCVRCGARIERRIEIRLIRVGSIVGSFIGIVALWFAAYYKQPQQVRVDAVTEMMNGALVKISGKVSSYDENHEKNTLRMKIDDGTGEISVSAFNKLSNFKRVLGDNMPALGDEVDVVGTLNVTQKFGTSMFLSVPDRVKLIKKYEMRAAHIGELTKQNVGDVVRLHAHVASYETRSTRSGAVLHAIVLDDGTGTLDMTIFDAAMAKIPDETKKMLTESGRELEMAVKIGEYRGKLQADLVDAGGVKNIGAASASAPSAPAVSTAHAEAKPQEPAKPERSYRPSKGHKKISELSESDAGTVYDFDAEIISVDSRGKGTLVGINDGSGDLKMMIWNDLSGVISGFDQLKVGAKLSGSFVVDDFRGHLQLKIEDPRKVRIK